MLQREQKKIKDTNYAQCMRLCSVFISLAFSGNAHHMVYSVSDSFIWRVFLLNFLPLLLDEYECGANIMERYTRFYGIKWGIFHHKFGTVFFWVVVVAVIYCYTNRLWNLYES